MATRAAANLEKIPITMRKKLALLIFWFLCLTENIPAKVTGLAICTSSQCNDTVVLSECGHGRDCHQSSQQTVHTICENTT
jgi:hypothetical protein